jgi:hypothetical protein
MNDLSTMHYFHFTKPIAFTCADPDSAFVFEPAINKFHWYGKALDKLGKYMLVEKGDQVLMELQYNYAREQTYTVISTQGSGDELTAFVLKCHKTGELYSFSRV